MRFHGTLVSKQMIEAAIKAVLVDLLITKLQKIAERRAAVPVLGNMQLAGRFAEPPHHKHGRRLRPSDALLACWQHLIAQVLKACPAPQGERELYIAKPTRALDADELP